MTTKERIVLMVFCQQCIIAANLDAFVIQQKQLKLLTQPEKKDTGNH